MNIELRIVQAENPNAAEHQNCREQVLVGHTDQAYPHADHRQVEHDQEEIADPHGNDDAPEERRLFGDHRGAGLNALDDHRADHQRHHRV